MQMSWRSRPRNSTSASTTRATVEPADTPKKGKSRSGHRVKGIHRGFWRALSSWLTSA
jgi:hypothetical protein